MSQPPSALAEVRALAFDVFGISKTVSEDDRQHLNPDLTVDPCFDLVAEDFYDLADQLGLPEGSRP